MHCGELIIFVFEFKLVYSAISASRKETKQAYCIDKQKINTTGINDDCITTERPAANTRLSDNSRIRAVLEVYLPH